MNGTMDWREQVQTLQRMLIDAKRLVASGDPMLASLYGSVESRIELLIALQSEREAADESAQPPA